MTLRRPLMIAFLLLAFASQLLANASMTCGFEKPVNATATHMHHDMSGMPMHDMASMDHSQNHSSFTHHHSSVDCCKLMGHCSMGCALFGIDKDKIFSLQKQSSIAEDFYSLNTPTPLITTHYRPPILAFMG